MDDCLDFLMEQVRAVLPYAPNEIGLNHSKFPVGRDLAGIGNAADPGLFLMASLWPNLPRPVAQRPYRQGRAPNRA